MQVPILQSVYGQKGPDFERSFPLNLVPFAEPTGISQGYLRSAPGIVEHATGQGADGGAMVWNDLLYRISGTKLISVDENDVVTVIGELGGTGQGAFAQSFDRLAVARNNALFYLQGSTLSQVTDPDLGDVVDVVWIDGFFVTTDGSLIVITELVDPTQVDPVKYGSAEADPDPVRGLLSLRGELYAFGRYTIEVFRNAGTSGFPFQRNRGAQIDKGIVGTHAKCAFLDTFAFVGSGRGEKPRVYLYSSGQAAPISHRTLDKLLGDLTETELADVVLEARHGDGAQELFVHLPAVTYVYSHTVSTAIDMPVWYRLAGGSDGARAYRARNFTYAYGGWRCGDVASAALGKADDTVTSVFGETVAWFFDSALLYTAGRGAICHDLELVGNYGRAAVGAEPKIFMSWTDDGLVYSQERAARSGAAGQRRLRVAWRRNGHIEQWRAFRFRSVTDAPVSFSRMEAQMEELGG